MEDAEEYCIDDDSDEDKKKARPIIKNAMDLQRLKLEKLMKNPDKPILIPEPPKEKDFMQTVPTFVRNVMGSSAGAGSGEFHVYRHLRRKEYARQKFIQAKSIREQLDDDYRQKLEQNKADSDAKTAKKRAKRLKKKQKMKEKGKRRKKEPESDQSKEEEVSEDEESNEDEDSIENKPLEKIEADTNQDKEGNLQRDEVQSEEGAASNSETTTGPDIKQGPAQDGASEHQEIKVQQEDKTDEGTDASKNGNRKEVTKSETDKDVGEQLQDPENVSSQSQTNEKSSE